MNFLKGFALDFDLRTGLSGGIASTKRYLSQMRGMYADEAAYDALLAMGDPLVYEFYEIGTPEDAGDVAAGTSIVYPGKGGKEFFMTKGHFHSVLETAEVYYCLAGKGYMLIENKKGDWSAQEMFPGGMVYVPKGYAHRSVNTSNEPLVTFFAFRGDAGHDYGTIEKTGFRKLVLESGIVDNPKYC